MNTLQEKATAPSKFRLTLYVAGDEPNSRLAIRHLNEICTGVLAKQCEIEVVDVYQFFQRALKDRVIVTPTLIVSTDNPVTTATFYGTLHDRQILLNHLGHEAT